MKLALIMILLSASLFAQINFADEESPTGAINGVNARFLLAHTPNPFGSVAVFKNGLRQRKCLACDLTAFLSGGRAVVLFNACCIPKTGDVIVVDYRWGDATAPIAGTTCAPPLSGSMDGAIVYAQAPDKSCFPLIAVADPTILNGFVGQFQYLFVKIPGGGTVSPTPVQPPQ